MPKRPRRIEAATDSDDARPHSVPIRAAGVCARLLTPDALARSIGVGRLVLGGSFLVAPVTATRVLGVDTATAKRVSFLAQMMAARDVAIGAGTAASVRRRSDGRPRQAGRGDSAGWLLAGAVADAADAVVIARALRSGRARGAIATGLVGGAAALAAVATYGAAQVMVPGFTTPERVRSGNHVSS